MLRKGLHLSPAKSAKKSPTKELSLGHVASDPDNSSNVNVVLFGQAPALPCQSHKSLSRLKLPLFCSPVQPINSHLHDFKQMMGMHCDRWGSTSSWSATSVSGT